ncbi:hypothetical protein A2Z67_04450 [Candidatus Woesebacteria bacterium RBG_13_36_22]|uniref:DNA topoisomerase n=1 Tax=Candidatus Woesebacteria bacterium RBG_13_36_22 TaxID=1802478 RepID=A0A1F7X2Q9_9BACT|nr:MAG: hypothetical protein A2Z67_04450 [Candidatus Woesebacteria bacterium RBG_13_36_22]
MIDNQPKAFILIEKSIPLGLIPQVRLVRGKTKTFHAIRYVSAYPDKVNVITRDKINVDAIKPSEDGTKWYAGVKVDEIAQVIDFKEPAETGLVRCVIKTDGTVAGKKYTDKKKERGAKVKWARLKYIEKYLPTIRAKYEPMIGDSNPIKKSFGVAMYCVDRFCMRIGGGAHNREDHFGTTTLQCKHISQAEDGVVYLDFVGKSGVDWHIKVDDPNVGKALMELKDDREPESKLLYEVERKDVVKWLGRFRVTAKDFRTYHASNYFVEFAKKSIMPLKRKAQKEVLADIITRVATKLNNKPNTCRSKYIMPALMEHWLMGGKF